MRAGINKLLRFIKYDCDRNIQTEVIGQMKDDLIK